MRKSIFDAKDGILISEDELGFHWEESYEFGGDVVKMSKVSQDSEGYYGLGDKPVHINLKGLLIAVDGLCCFADFCIGVPRFMWKSTSELFFSIAKR